MKDTQHFLAQAVALARDNIKVGGSPFAAVVVKNGEVIATGVNEFHLSHDITDHAELLAIRTAARAHGPDAVKDSTVYASGQPCLMCLSAMRIAGVGTIAFAHSDKDWAPFSPSSVDLYAELMRPFAEQSIAISHVPLADQSSPALYEEWAQARTGSK